MWRWMHIIVLTLAIRFMGGLSTGTELQGSVGEDGSYSNGKFLDISMMYFDSVAFLMSIDLGVPEWISMEESKEGGGQITPEDLASRFGLTLRASSALLVTLCRLEVVSIAAGNADSVDLVSYELTPEARLFLADKGSAAYTSHFIQSLHSNFITPQKLLDASKPTDKDALMTQHLDETHEEAANSARHFMKHMNSQSYSCAKAFPSVVGLVDRKEDDTSITMLDVGGGSGIYTIEAVRSNPSVQGVILELANIAPITREFVADATLEDRISVVEGDFFTDEAFPSADIALFANILHDWPDETNLELIRKAYDSINPGGRIVISELLLADDIRSSSSASTNMNIIMIPWTQGRQYRPKELFRRLSAAGFVNPRVVKLVDDYSLVFADKPSEAAREL